MANITKEIQVTQEDIAKGVKENAECCPIALALNRAFPECDIADVSESAIVCFDDGSWAEYGSDEIGSFISAFDAGDPVQPFNFTFRADVNYPDFDDEEYEE